MPAIPLPSLGDMSGDSELQETERERLRNPDGCLCNGGGCSGSACGSLNGCVCNSSGRCWGAACSARVPVPNAAPVAGQLTQVVNSASSAPQLGQLSSPPGVQQVLSSLSPLNLVRNALMAQPALVNGQQVMQITPLSAGNNVMTPAQGTECTCTQNGCSGGGCASLNGCFCVGQNCWGNACQSSVFSQQVRQPAQQSGNLFDIPDLFGGNGAGGGGMDVEGQVIPVVQGMPVKRLNGQRARRIRTGMRGRRGMSGMAASGRIRTRARPEQVMRKRTRIRNSGANNNNDDDDEANDWEAKPIFKRVNVNGIPTFVRFSRRTDSTSQAGEAANRRLHSSTQPVTHIDDEVTDDQKQNKSPSLPGREVADDQQPLSGEESERLESVYEEPLLFSEDVLDVNIVSLDER